MAERKRKTGSDCLGDVKAYEELLRVYGAWLGYLLSRLDEGELRVQTSEISKGLDAACVSAWREGDEYVIRVQKKDVNVNGGEKEQT
ncbi:MAG: hypothetical protein E7589_02115 [Ruminococcaceae bacterium]|nr:hypothetical protein [Oscillospiraceae bacterium]